MNSGALGLRVALRCFVKGRLLDFTKHTKNTHPFKTCLPPSTIALFSKKGSEA
jgi:hypothetical protein